MTTDELFALLRGAAEAAIDIAADEDGQCMEITVTPNGLLIAAMVQHGATSYDHHAAPDGYCNAEITWEELTRLNDLAIRALLADLLLCAVEGEADDDDPTDVAGSAQIIRFKPRTS